MISCRCQRGIVSGVASDAMSVRSSAEYLAEHGQPPALVVGQFETLSAELLLQDAVLLAEVPDGGILLAGDPAGHTAFQNRWTSTPAQGLANLTKSQLARIVKFQDGEE